MSYRSDARGDTDEGTSESIIMYNFLAAPSPCASCVEDLSLQLQSFQYIMTKAVSHGANHLARAHFARDRLERRFPLTGITFDLPFNNYCTWTHFGEGPLDAIVLHPSMQSFRWLSSCFIPDCWESLYTFLGAGLWMNSSNGNVSE